MQREEGSDEEEDEEEWRHGAASLLHLDVDRWRLTAGPLESLFSK